jgi:hypothetical protein
MRKVSSMVACRLGRPPSHRACRRFHHLCASGSSLSFSNSRDIAPPDAQLPHQSPPQLPSACEQAFSHELLLGLTRDTVLAAVPWLRFSPKARH